MNTAYIAIIASISGAMVGGLISYFNSTRLSKLQRQADNQRRQNSSRRILLWQLQYSVEYLNSDDYGGIVGVIYLADWPKYLEECNFEKQERIAIIKWLQSVYLVGEQADENIRNGPIRMVIDARSLTNMRISDELKGEVNQILTRYNDEM